MEEHNEIDILLIEDNPRDVELTLRAFKKSNLTNRIHVIEDGAKALEYLFAEDKQNPGELTHTPRLILLDLKLPKVDGLEILRKLKADERTKMIPVVILTSSQQEQDMITSYKLGVNSYIIKPIDFNKFVESVETLGLYWMLLNQYPR
jgi:two-component system response regulator